MDDNISLVFCIAIAGGLGATTRLLVYRSLKVFSSKIRFPIWLTVVNFSGSFVMGLILGLAFKDFFWVTVLTAGFLGGYTTFSSASLDTVKMLKQRRYFVAAVNAFGQIIVCIIAVMLGYLLVS